MADQTDPNRITPTTSDPSTPADLTAPTNPTPSDQPSTGPVAAPTSSATPQQQITDAARQQAIAQGKLDPRDPAKPTTMQAMAEVQNAAHDAEIRTAADAERQRRDDRSFVCPTCGSDANVKTVPCPECTNGPRPGRRIVTNAVGEQIDYGVCPRCNGTQEMFMAGPRTLASPRPKQPDQPITGADNATTTGVPADKSTVPADSHPSAQPAVV